MKTNLELRLHKNKINYDNLKSLLESYQQNPDTFVAFLGAGIGTSLRGVPDLGELYTSICKQYNCLKDEGNEFPDLFYNLYVKIDDKESFDKYIFGYVIPKNTRATSAHVEIAGAFNCFASTNYYDPIEDAFRTKQRLVKKEPPELKNYYFSFPAKEDAKYTLTYLHGNPQIGFCVLRKKDYRYFYPSLYERGDGVYTIENSLNTLLLNWSIVFLGCSIESHLKRIIQYLKTNRKEKLKTHYWIASDLDIKNYLRNVPIEKKDDFESRYFSEYAKMNIKPVIYHEDQGHVFIEDLCITLANLLGAGTTRLEGNTYDPYK